MRICIDAGHGGIDSGALGPGGRMEKSDTLMAAKALGALMQKRGHSVIMTRTADPKGKLALSERVAAANNAQADVFISLHRNSASESARGVEVLYRTVTDKSAANNARSKTLAAEIDRRIAAASGLKDRGAKAQNTNTYVLQHTLMPAVTVEAGFISSPWDNNIFDTKFNAIVEAIAGGIEAVFGRGSGTAAPAAGGAPSWYKRLLKLTSPIMTGDDVKAAQECLYRHKSLPGGKRDGQFGANTRKGVLLFQEARQKEGRDIGSAEPDGKIGPKTAAILGE